MYSLYFYYINIGFPDCRNPKIHLVATNLYGYAEQINEIGDRKMAESKFLCYKDKPLVRKGNEIYYGDMSEKYVVRFEILSSKTEDKLEIADKVSIQLLKNDTDAPLKDRISKESTKSSLFEALDIGFVWLERALKEN